MRSRPAERVETPSSTRAWAAGVAALTLLAFLPTLLNGWVDFDDTAFIVKNSHLSPLSFENIRWMATAFYGGHFHPLTWLSLALNLAVFGPGPQSFHLTDLILHCANAALFFLIARRLLKGGDAPAAAAALFFSIHPLRVESVAWAIERRDVLSAFFYFATILLHLKALDEPISNWRPLSWLTYACSLLSKSVGLTLPLALTALDVYPLRRKGAWREKVPYWTMAAAAAAAAVIAESENGSTLGLSQFPIAQRLAVAIYGLAFYVRKTLLPNDLLPLYELPRHLEPFSAPYLVSALFVAGILAFLIALRKRLPAAAAAGAFYFITIAPALGWVRFGPQLAADRYSYLACSGFALLFGAAFRTASASSAERRNAARLAVLVLGALGAQTFRQTARWRDPVTLWSYALENDPNIAMGQQHLGYALAGRGRYDQAVVHYRKAVELRSDYWLAYDNLGWSLAALGRLDEACAAYRKALEFKPDYWEARSNLGLALGRQNKLAEAENEFREALKIAPNEPGLHSNLGLVYFARRQTQEAAREFGLALELDPRQPQARMMLQRLGRL